jgi:hypothetical protein
LVVAVDKFCTCSDAENPSGIRLMRLGAASVHKIEIKRSHFRRQVGAKLKNLISKNLISKKGDQEAFLVASPGGCDVPCRTNSLLGGLSRRCMSRGWLPT